MQLNPFKLERYFAKYEFSAPFMLSSSDCEPLTMAELLASAPDDLRQMWDELWLGYTESKGHPQLLATVAELYDHIEPPNVIEVVPEEGILIAMTALLEPGDHVVCTAPGYQSLYEVARGIGCEVTLWYPDPAAGWRFDVDVLADLLQSNTRMIVVNFPHNPTGNLMDPESFARVVELARAQGAVLFSDEMYRLSEYDPADRLPAACEVYENAVTLSGLSKVFGLAGLRLGWLVTQDADIMKRFVTLKDYTTICGSAPSEILGLMALRNREQFVGRNMTIIQSNMALLDDFFERHAESFRWARPRAGSIAFAELRIDRPISEFCEALVAAQGVMLLPASVYDYAGNYFRLGFGRRNMPEALARLESFLETSL